MAQRRASILRATWHIASRGVVAGIVAGAVGCGLIIGLSDHEPYPVEADGSIAPDAPDVATDVPDAVTATTCDAGADPRYLNDVIDIAVGDGFSCALRADGTVVCWGANQKGMLGTSPFNGGPMLSSRPSLVTGLPKVRHVAAGFFSACAIDLNANLWCWGHGPRVGDGDPDASRGATPPRRVVDKQGIPIVGVTEVSMGLFHTCAIVEGGSIACWGENGFGQLGPLHDGETINYAGLVPVIGGATAISAGLHHTCVLREAGQRQVDCWGLGSSGQLGAIPDGSPSWYSANAVTMPLTNAGAGVPVALSSGYRTTCIVDKANKLYATGKNDQGQIGALSKGAQLNAPTAVQGLANGRTASAACGSDSSCALLTDGTVQCIGRNSFGELGRGTMSASELEPAPVVGLGWKEGHDAGVLRDVVKVGIGGGQPSARGCALVKAACADAGSVVCWGSNGGGELGTGEITEPLPPVRVVAPAP